MRLVVRRSKHYAKEGVGLFGSLLKHSLVPLKVLRDVLPERGLVLDLGSGEGMLGNLVAASRPGISVLGVDLDHLKTDLANRCAARNARFQVMDVLDLENVRAAAAIFNDVLHHHPDDLQLDLLKKAWQLLDDRGVLVLKEVDISDSPDRLWTTFWDSRIYPADRLNFHSVEKWKELLFNAGFELGQVHRVRHPWPASRTVLVCTKRSQIGVASAEKLSKTSLGSVKVLVTGASGFVGGHLVRHLVSDGLGGRKAEVTILVRDEKNVPDELRSHCRVLIGDLESEEVVKQAIVGMEYVFHLAADKDFFGGRRVYENNVRATTTLLDALEGSRDLRRLVFASSMGAIDRHASDLCSSLLDEQSPAYPSSPYGRAKLDCEVLLARSAIPFTIVRLPWCYGTGMTPKTHLRMLTEMVVRGKTITRFDWPGRVSLVSVDECIRALIFLATHPRSLGQIFFVSDGEPIRFGSLFREIGRTVGRPAGNIPLPRMICWIAERLRRFLPFAVRSLLLDVMCVSNNKLRELGFDVCPRNPDFVLPLARYISQQRYPSIQRSSIVVTGSASGIGYRLAVQLAGAGRHVIMVDRDPNVRVLAGQVPGATPFVADLSSEKDVVKVCELIESEAVTCVVNSAGIGTHGDVVVSRGETLSALLDLNVKALTELSRTAVRVYRKMGAGILVNIASSAAFQPLPRMATYAASKAYVLSFTEALSEEERGRPGIAILAVCPSGVATRFQGTAGVKRADGERLLDASSVSGTILQAIERGRSGTVFVGVRTREMAMMARIIPRSVNLRIWKHLMDRYR